MSGVSQITYKSSWPLSSFSGIKLVIVKPLSIYCLLESAAYVLSRDCSLPGSSIHGILQAKILAWVAIFFSFNVSGVHLLSLVYFETVLNECHSLNKDLLCACYVPGDYVFVTRESNNVAAVLMELTAL